MYNTLMREMLVWTILFYLRFWARIALLVHRPYVIGIAGSVGKSSTRNALNAVLKERFTTKVVYGNSETGIPMGILGLPIEGFTKKNWLRILLRAPLGITKLRKIQYLIIEMGIDDPEPPKNMSYLLTIVKPDMAIDLNATATHTMQFEKILPSKTKDSLNFILGKIADEDTKIITNGYTKVGIYNNDDEKIRQRIDKNAPKDIVTLLTFGSEPENTATYAGYEINEKKTKFTYRVNAARGKRDIDISLFGFLLPPASQESFAAVLLSCHALGLGYDEIKKSLEKNFSLPKGRSTMLNGIKNSVIIDSSYNSSKSSVLSFLSMLKKLKDKTGRPVIFLMGDMRELGKEAAGEHKEVAQALLPVVDELYCVGPQTLEYVVPIVKETIGRRHRPKRVEWYKNSIQAGLHMKEEMLENAIVLVKGSQNTIYLEEAIKFILNTQSDLKFLTRQEDYWMVVKKSFFNI